MHIISSKGMFYVYMQERVFIVPNIVINGLNKLDGEIIIQGAKNSVLPILASTILCKGDCVLHNCPKLSDVNTTIEILNNLGCSVKSEGNTLIVNTDNMCNYNIPNVLMRELRSSIIFLGSISSRFNKSMLSFPGGCELGPRPIDMHLESLRKMGLNIYEHNGILDCETKSGLYGTQIALSFPSVGATENIILAAVKSKGTTTITNAAREPEIIDLINFLCKCGAKIFGAGQSTITIEGVKELFGAEHTVIPDRIVTTTFMAAVGAAKGNLLLRNVDINHLESIISIFKEAGCDLRMDKNEIQITCNNRLNGISKIRTMPYPGFPTDAQALIMAMMTTSNSTTMFIENVFENRYKHVDELLRLGANIRVEGKVAIVEGVERLSGAFIQANDLRGAASLIVAGLAAEGKTEIVGTEYIDRGYQDIEKSLSSIGASIKRM